TAPLSRSRSARGTNNVAASSKGELIKHRRRRRSGGHVVDRCEHVDGDPWREGGIAIGDDRREIAAREAVGREARRGVSTDVRASRKFGDGGGGGDGRSSAAGDGLCSVGINGGGSAGHGVGRDGRGGDSGGRGGVIGDWTGTAGDEAPTPGPPPAVTAAPTRVGDRHRQEISYWERRRRRQPGREHTAAQQEPCRTAEAQPRPGFEGLVLPTEHEAPRRRDPARREKESPVPPALPSTASGHEGPRAGSGIAGPGSAEDVSCPAGRGDRSSRTVVEREPE
ncbi:unnamed protein product, partial [Scytosiphon promiscuus]